MMRRAVGILLAIVGAFALAGIALHRDEPINALWLVTAALCAYVLGYRFYARWIETRVFVADTTRATPAERLNNGRDFLPTHRWVVFGHHFAAIAGAGPLVGPTLAMQFGYLPGTLWIIVGAVLGGCVQDMMILFMSTRRDGRSLGQMARDEMGPIGGTAAVVGTLMIIIIIIAVLALVIVNAMKHSPWATSTVFATLPIAVVVGFYVRNWRPGRILEGSILGSRAAAGGRRGRRRDGHQRDAAQPPRLAGRVAGRFRDRLWLDRGDPAGLAAARAARLHLDVPEDCRRGAAGGRDRDSCGRSSRCRR